MRASKSLNECSFQSDPTLPSPVFAHGSLTQDLIQETIADRINSFVSTFSTATKPSKSMPLHYSKLSCLISRTSTTMDYAILLSICHYEAPTRKLFFFLLYSFILLVNLTCFSGKIQFLSTTAKKEYVSHFLFERVRSG